MSPTTAVTTYQPRTPHSDSINVTARLFQMRKLTRLFGSEPEKPGYELHSFECPKAVTLKRQ